MGAVFVQYIKMMLKLALICSIAHGAIAHGFAENGIIVLATSTNFSRFQYVPIPQMTEICEGLHKEVLFHCDSIWESGAIGSYNQNHDINGSYFNSSSFYSSVLNVPNITEINLTSGEDGQYLSNDTTWHTRVLESALNLLVKDVNAIPPNAYTWSALIDVPLLPIKTDDGNFIWKPV